MGQQQYESPAISAREAIQNLARTHHIHYQSSLLDEMGDAITRLAGNDVRLDDTELLLLALKRAGVVGDEEGDRLHIAYMRQGRA